MGKEIGGKIIVLLGVIGIVAASSYGGWYYYMSSPIDFGSIQLEFKLVEKAEDPKRVFNTSKTFTLKLSYDRFEKQEKNKHLDFTYHIPPSWQANASNHLLEIHMYNNTIHGNQQTQKHYEIQKIDDRTLLWGLIGIVKESRTLTDLGETFKLTLWEVGTGPHPDVGS